MLSSDLVQLEEMWTTNRHNYVLTDDRETLPRGVKMGYGIFELARGQLLVVLIEDNDLHDMVAQRMLEAGVKVVPSPKEALALARSISG